MTDNAIVRILHLSDIHFSENNFWHGLQEQKTQLPHRYGHDPRLLIALDHKLKQLPWDLLVISGDLSRIGHLDSFSYVKNWLYHKMQIPGGGEIGLNLNEEDKKCFVVPGNHDCFNEHLQQHSLTNYKRFFPDISDRKIETVQVNGVNINVHLYDSTHKDGGFAEGHIQPTALQDWNTDNKTLDLVVVHHHLAQSPSHKRQKSLELKNVDQFLAFLLSKDVNGVLFGHTHESFFEKISADILRNQLAFQRKWSRWLRKRLPRYFSRSPIDSLSFARSATKSGRFPSFDKYFEYLYIKNILGKQINGPELFEEPKHFYDHIKSYRSDYSDRLRSLRKKKVAFSMAPTPVSIDSDLNGFHLLKFQWDGDKFLYECNRFLWDGADFALREEPKKSSTVDSHAQTREIK